MNKKRLVIWGEFKDYETYLPSFRLEEWKGNIEIAAVIFLDEQVVKRVDGYPVITAEELLGMTFDYVIGLENELAEDMIKILGMMQIPREKFLAGKIFNLPDFDFEQYLRLRESRISIISDNCWGGLTYHSLDYPFLSPFINMYVKEGDFGKLMTSFSNYMQMPLEFVKTELNTLKGNIYPVCRIGDVEIHCNHYESFEQAKKIWDDRKVRINYKNIFVKMLIETEKDLAEFKEIPYRKIGFSTFSVEDEEIIDCSGMSGYIGESYQGRFWEFVNWQARSDRVDLKHYNVLKLLLGEEDYKRTE